MPSKKKYLLFIPIVLTLIVIDQLSKYFVKRLDDFPHWISPIYNKGIAFGINLPDYFTWALIGIILAWLIFQTFKYEKNLVSVIVLALAVGGAISNFIDRIIEGAVFDFISVGVFPVFNLADSAIVIGLLTYLLINLKQKPHEARGNNTNNREI